MPPLRLMATRPWRLTWAVLNVVPVPGAGAVAAGARNPHTGLLRNGVAQVLLVLLGSWPLVLPGAAGLAWAVWDAVRIGRAEEIPAPARSPDA